MTDPFLHDDAAYVLGILPADERAAFEAHLETCPDCQARVAEIARVPALLTGITEADLVAADVDSTPPDTLLPSLLREVSRRRRRRVRLTAGVAGLAAAAIVALSVALTVPGSSSTSTPRPQAMAALVASPVSATAALKTTDWGTRITLKCRYDLAYAPDFDYNLVVFDKNGAAHQAGSWRLVPHEVTNYTTGTSLRADQISKIQIQAGSKPILQLTI